MTDQLIDQRGTAQETWDRLKQSKFTDSDIRQIIVSAVTSGTCEWTKANAQTAQAMIAYNNMIDARIERAQRTWGLK